MKNKKNILLSVLLTWGMFAFTVQASSTSIPSNLPITAQTQPAPSSNQATIIADINFRNPLVTSQKNNIFQIYFRMENNLPQSESGIRYGVQLIGGDKLADEKIYTDDTLSVEGKNSIQKIFTYTAPEYLSGNFDLWLIAKNESGLPLAAFKLKDPITLTGNGEYLEVDQNSCALKIDGEAQDKKYTLMQGVSLKNSETLKLNCDAISHFKEAKTIYPTQITFPRSVFGDQLGQPQKETPITLQPEEKKTITITIKKPTDPQAYDTLINFYNSNQLDQTKVAQAIDVHYVIAGESATIQKFDLDKIGYQKGDELKAALYFDTNGSFNVNLSLIITDQNKKDCINEYTQNLDQSQFKTEINLKAINNCQNPIATVSLKNDQNKILDQKTFTFEKDNQTLVDQSKNLKQVKSAVNTKTVLIIFILLLLFVSLAIIFRMRHQARKKNNNITKLFLLLVLLGGGLIMKGENVDAITLSKTQLRNDYWGSFNYAISLDNSVYSPGEAIIGFYSGSASLKECNQHDGNTTLIAFKNNASGDWQDVSGSWRGNQNFVDAGCTVYTGSSWSAGNAGSSNSSVSFKACITGESSGGVQPYCAGPSNGGGNFDFNTGDIYYSVTQATATCSSFTIDVDHAMVNDSIHASWTTTNATNATLYCATNSSNVYVNDSNAGTAYDLYGFQPTVAGTVTCTLTPYNGSTAGTACNATAEVCASGYTYNATTKTCVAPSYTCVTSGGITRACVNTLSDAQIAQYHFQVVSSLTCQSGETCYACADGYIWDGSACVANCTVTSWSPDPSTVCSGQSFTQTSNCNTTQTATGTKATGECCVPDFTQSDCNKYSVTCGSYTNSCGTSINCGTCPSGQTCSNGACVAPTTCTATCNSSGYSACLSSKPAGAVASSAGTCCNGESCYECPSGTSWSTTAKACVASTPTCECSLVFSGGNSCSFGTVCDGCYCTKPANNATCVASFSPASLTVPGTSYLTWSSTNATATYGYCTGPLPVSYDNYGLSYSAYPFSFTNSQSGTETCTFTPYNGSTPGNSCSASVNLSAYSPGPAPTCVCGQFSCIDSCGKNTCCSSPTTYSDCNGLCTGDGNYVCKNGLICYPKIVQNTDQGVCRLPSNPTDPTCASSADWSVSLSANPNSGQSPLTSVLSIAINNAYSGQKYNIYPHCGGSASPTNISNSSFTCIYNSTGTYSPSVQIIDSNTGVSKNASTNVTVTSCSRDCSCASNTCVGSSCNDGCGGVCNGTKSDVCPDISCESKCGVQKYSSTCGNQTCTKDCGPCNSGKWQEVTPSN